MFLSVVVHIVIHNGGNNGDIQRSLKCQNLSEKYRNIKSTYFIKQIQRQKERPTVLDNLILLKRYICVQ